MFKKISWTMARTLRFVVFYLALSHLPFPRSIVALKTNTLTTTATVIISKLMATGGDYIGLEISKSAIPQKFDII